MVRKQLYQVAYIPKNYELSSFAKTLMGNESKTVTRALLKEDAELLAIELREKGYRGVEVFDAHCFTDK